MRSSGERRRTEELNKFLREQIYPVVRSLQQFDPKWYETTREELKEKALRIRGGYQRGLYEPDLERFRTDVNLMCGAKALEIAKEWLEPLRGSTPADALLKEVKELEVQRTRRIRSYRFYRRAVLVLSLALHQKTPASRTLLTENQLKLEGLEDLPIG